MVEKPGTFTHKVDRSQIPTCNIMGVDIAAIDMDWLLDFTFRNIRDLSGDYMCVSNVHTTVMSWEDKDYRTIQNEGILAIPDSGPLSSVGRKRGHQNMERTTDPDYMEGILKVNHQNGYRHYFYGSIQEILRKLKARLAANYPGIRIAGMHSLEWLYRLWQDPAYIHYEQKPNGAIFASLYELFRDKGKVKARRMENLGRVMDKENNIFCQKGITYQYVLGGGRFCTRIVHRSDKTIEAACFLC